MESALAALPDGAQIFLPGASGEPGGVMSALYDGWPAGKRLKITTTFLPGINVIDFDRLDPAIEVAGLFLPREYADAARLGQYRHVPISYAAFGRWIDTQARFDATLVQVSPPDRDGRYSLGPSVEYTMQAIARSDNVIAVVNPNVPFMPLAPALTADMITMICASDAALPTYAVASDDQSTAVAQQVAKLIDDGTALQIGIGKIPGALLGQLQDRRNLRFWSGLVSDGVMDLVAACVTPADGIGHACLCLGTTEFYEWLRNRRDIVLHGCDRSHNTAIMQGIDGFVAVNGAVEVDLFGQCNLERIGGRSLSGAGGAPDFASAARRGIRSKSIVALPAQAGGKSRIVPVIGAEAMVTLSRTEIDYVVTENGIADLRFASVPERAERLIEIAAPDHRDELRTAWQNIMDRL